MRDGLCTECDKPVRARGWCGTHYERWRRNGSPHLQYQPSVEERFWSKVNRDGPWCERLGSSCWSWTGYVSASGYGTLYYDRRVGYAHVFSFGLEGDSDLNCQQVDHRCLNRGCVNPHHLRLATPKQNAEHQNLRSDNKSGYRGVRWNTARGMWRADIQHFGKSKFLGHFDTALEADLVARAARNQSFTHNDLDREVQHQSP